MRYKFSGKIFVKPDLQIIFAVPKGGAIAHPDSYREVEQCSDSYRNENPCALVPIAIGTIPRDKNEVHRKPKEKSRDG